jgi:hypothetical protein
MLLHRAIIPLKPDYDKSELKYFKHSTSCVVNGATEKTSFEIPQVSEEFIMYGLLMFI